MLELVVEAANQGNTGGRYFPCSGYFGLSKVVIAGSITTRIPPLAQPLYVKAIYANIRCTEARTAGSLGTSADNIVWEKSKVLWEAPDYVEFGEWSKTFKLTIPPDVAKLAPSSQCLREWKATWRFEIAIEHKPIPYVGNRLVKGFYLNLKNHATPIASPSSPPAEACIGSDAFTTLVQAIPPAGSFGPDDTIHLSFHAKPVDSTAMIRKAIVTLERIVEHGTDLPKISASIFRRSPSPIEEGSALASASTESLTPGDGGFSWRTLSLALPNHTSRWDLGETARTKLITVRFQLRLRLTVKAGKSKDFELPPIPLHVMSVSSAARSNARSAVPIVHLRESRRHRSSRRGLYLQEGTVDINDPVVTEIDHERSASPTYRVHHTTSSNVKPILLSPDHPAQPQSITFAFPSSSPPALPAADCYPSPPPTAPHRPSIANLINHTSTVPSASPQSHDWSRRSQSSELESFSIIKQFQQTGRRISATASEEEFLLPSRSRQRLVEEDSFGRPVPLPSLDTLGLGLPQVVDRRPVTAPSASSSRFANFFSRPKSSHSTFNSASPVIEESPRLQSQAFAFTVKESQ